MAILHWSDGIGTLECLGEGTVTLTACQYSSDRNYKNAEPVVKILTISKADGIGAEKVSSMEVYGLRGHDSCKRHESRAAFTVYTSDGVLLHEETCDGSNMDLAVPCSGLYLVKAGIKRSTDSEVRTQDKLFYIYFGLWARFGQNSPVFALFLGIASLVLFPLPTGILPSRQSCCRNRLL